MLYSYLEKQEEIEIIKKKHTEMELQFLKSQINPHVLFNNLNTIYSYSLEKPKEVPGMILKLSDNLKHVLYESNAHKIDLQKELDYIDNYIAFQKIRTENIKQVNYRKDIENNELEIAPLLLITIIENAFKHSSTNSTIKIDINVKNGYLECITENLVKPTSSDDKGINIGMENLQKRLNLLYNEKYDMQITNGSLYKVRLKIQLTWIVLS